LLLLQQHLFTLLQNKLLALEHAYERHAAQHAQLHAELTDMLQHTDSRSVTVRVAAPNHNGDVQFAQHTAHDPTMPSCSRRHQPTTVMNR